MSVHIMTRSQLLNLPIKSPPVVNEALGISLFDDDGQSWIVWSDADGVYRMPDTRQPPHGRHIINDATTAE